MEIRWRSIVFQLQSAGKKLLKEQLPNDGLLHVIVETIVIVYVACILSATMGQILDILIQFQLQQAKKSPVGTGRRYNVET